MTLIVFKKNILAADTRTTHMCSAQRNNVCAHCGKGASSVNEKAKKVHIAKEGTKFRNDVILAHAAAGDVELINRIRDVLDNKFDIEQIFAGYLAIHGMNTRNSDGCSFLLIGEKKNYTFTISTNGGKLRVIEYTKEQEVFIGSARVAARWVNEITQASAMSIINIVMAKDDSIGGEIDYVDFRAEKPEVKRYDKKDPAMVLSVASQAYRKGIDILTNSTDQQAPKEKGKPGRKAKTPEQKAADKVAKEAASKPAAKKPAAKKVAAKPLEPVAPPEGKTPTAPSAVEPMAGAQ